MKSLMQTKLFPAIGILLFASVAGYLVFAARANVNFRGDWDWLHSHNFQIAWEFLGGSNYSFNAGQKFDENVVATELIFDDAKPYQLLVALAYDRRDVEFLGYTCSSSFTCHESSFNRKLEGNYWSHNPEEFGNLAPDTTYLHYLHKVICIDAPKNMYHSNGSLPLFTVHLKALRIIKAEGESGVDQSWQTLPHGVAPGSCADNPDANNVLWYSTGGKCGSSKDGCDTGYGNIPSLAGDPITNQSIQTNGTAGGGGGGSSANRQNNDHTVIPSTSSQGENHQSKLEPSPFFDGRQYKPGSDQDTLGNTVASTGKKIARTWPVVLGVITLGGMAGFGYWKWKRTRL